MGINASKSEQDKTCRKIVNSLLGFVHQINGHNYSIYSVDNKPSYYEIVIRCAFLPDNEKIILTQLRAEIMKKLPSLYKIKDICITIQSIYSLGHKTNPSTNILYDCLHLESAMIAKINDSWCKNVTILSPFNSKDIRYHYLCLLPGEQEKMISSTFHAKEDKVGLVFFVRKGCVAPLTADVLLGDFKQFYQQLLILYADEYAISRESREPLSEVSDNFQNLI